MSYLVLARKYRPQRFDELCGQEHVARTLTNAIEQGRVHHAFLFTGARGVGKTSAARILAKALCCAHGPTPNPCGTCEICREIASGQSVDVFEIDAASNTKVEETRDLLEGVRYAPARTRKKIYIIDEVHMLSTHSFNALLKTLEEPPGHVVFILATTEVHKIPITILSRCQRYDFKLVSTARLEKHLGAIVTTERLSIEPEALRLVARQGRGSVRDSLSLLDQVIAYVGTEAKITRDRTVEVLGLVDHGLLCELGRLVLARDTGAALRLFARAADRDADGGQLARSFLAFLRDLEVAAAVTEPGDLIDASAEELADMRALATSAPAGLLGVLFDRWARALDEATRSLAPRLLFEMALCDLCRAEPIVPLGDLLDRLEGLDRRLGGGGGPSRTPGPPAVRAPVPTHSVAAAPVAPAAPAAPVKARGIAEAWPAALERLSQNRKVQLAALLEHASIAEGSDGRVTLVFENTFSAEQAERSRGDIEQALAAVAGRPVTIRVTTGAAAPPSASVAPSRVSREADAALADRHKRADEARAHPMVRKAAELFGATVREIKTD